MTNVAKWTTPDLIYFLKRMIHCHQIFFNDSLVEQGATTAEKLPFLFDLDQPVLSHQREEDPILNYGNKAALELWEMTWDDFTKMPSRKTAEEVMQSERAKFMRAVTENGYVDNYEGVRISSTGKKFYIKNARVWNILNDQKKIIGQAATFKNWEVLIDS